MMAVLSFLKIKYLSPVSAIKFKDQLTEGCKRICDKHQPTPALTQKSNYVVFNCNNFNIRYWSWNYRGFWHQTCPPIVTC